MKTYIYRAIDRSAKLGYNRTIVVYRIINNKPVYVGSNAKINTVSTYGDKGEAIQIAGKVKGHKHDMYEFDSDNIQMISL